MTKTEMAARHFLKTAHFKQLRNKIILLVK